MTRERCNSIPSASRTTVLPSRTRPWTCAAVSFGASLASVVATQAGETRPTDDALAVRRSAAGRRGFSSWGSCFQIRQQEPRHDMQRGLAELRLPRPVPQTRRRRRPRGRPPANGCPPSSGLGRCWPPLGEPAAGAVQWCRHPASGWSRAPARRHGPSGCLTRRRALGLSSQSERICERGRRVAALFCDGKKLGLRTGSRDGCRSRGRR